MQPPIVHDKGMTMRGVLGGYRFPIFMRQFSSLNFTTYFYLEPQQSPLCREIEPFPL